MFQRVAVDLLPKSWVIFFFFLISKCVSKNLYNLYIYYIIKKKKKKNKSNNIVIISLLRSDFLFLNKRNKKKITFALLLTSKSINYNNYFKISIVL